MPARVFIDGEVGTTGLEIQKLLSNRTDIILMTLPKSDRKVLDARRRALNSCDIGLLCLPDAAAKEAVSIIENDDTRLIDASTAHRIHKDWIYGFPEMTSGHGELIADAKKVSNPGCYPTGVIALIRPLIESGILPSNYPFTINAVSGYSGGGKNLISRFEKQLCNQPPAYYSYGMSLNHKHLPEMKKHALLDFVPLFTPSVGRYYRGMLVQIPLLLWSIPGVPNIYEIQNILAKYYENKTFISVSPLAQDNTKVELNPESLNSTNKMKIQIFGREETKQCILTAIFDNLGKGASGAAIQSMNLMLGLDPDAGLKGEI